MEGNYMPTNYNEYKTRNILSLSERVEVIRECDRHLTRPSLQSLAQRFECSSKQIKNILLNRNSILESYKNGGDSGGGQKQLYSNNGDLMQKRQEKIAFLGKVMYEYIQRMLYFNQPIDDQKFRQKVLQIKECIAVENFQPTNAWLNDFKAKYGIPAFNLQSLRNNVVITEAKRPHLSAIDMIQYVSRLEQQSGGQNLNRSNTQDHFPKSFDHLPSVSHSPSISHSPNASHSPSANGHFNRSINHSNMAPKVVYEVDDEDGADDDELLKLNFDNSTPKIALHHNSFSNPSPNQKIAEKRCSTTPFPDIESVEDAIRHLKSLEVYAMMNDNYRAIGLLTQLEHIFRKKDKKEE